VTDDERPGRIRPAGTGSGITRDARVMGGKPWIRGTRVTVSTIAGLLASGHSEAKVLDLYPCLGDEDVRAVGEWAAERAGRRRRSAGRRSGAHR
jgi:uncharacterized protein (DUF433 family)